ncbi:MAG TPA: PPC domain-containing protein, partial [bacterium]|nr:PPC domain-containing protein [bacterium]
LSLWLQGLFFLLVPTSGQAQLAQPPHLGYLFPAGAQQGTTVEVVAAGNRLARTKAALISGKDVQVDVVEVFPPLRNLSPGQRQKLRTLVSEKLRKQAGLPVKETQPPEKDEEPLPRTPLLARLANPTREDLQRIIYEYFTPKRTMQFVPALAESVLLKVTISPQAEPGWRQLRLLSPAGLSRPLPFQIGSCPEVTELEPNEKPSSCPVMKLPVVINGQIEPGDVDTFRFKASQGQKLILVLSARRLVPFMADAVPGWFEGLLTLYDSGGKQLASADCHGFDPDPVICWCVPETGEYTVVVRDSLYRGRKDFVYRLSIGEGPFVEGIFPLGGKTGSKVLTKIYGWNLPVDSLSLNTDLADSNFRQICRIAGQWLAQPVSYHLDTLEECLEREPNNTMEKAQKVSPPAIVNGTIEKPGDVDLFSFHALAGESIVLEVIARRLGSPLDSFLQVKDASGRILVTSDDTEGPNIGILTHQADAYLSFRFPVTGTYSVQIGDTCQHGGPTYAYRLRISPPRPDFSVLVYPSGLTAATGQPVPVSFLALRQDGFDGPIHLSLSGTETGFSLQGATIPAGQSSVTCTLTGPARPISEPVCLSLLATAEISGQMLQRKVVPADEWEQAFIYKHLLPAEEFLVTVRQAWGLPLGTEVTGQLPVKIIPGEICLISLKVPGKLPENVSFNLVSPPAGLVLQESRTEPGQLTLTLYAGAEMEKSIGLANNLLIEVLREVTFPAAGKKRKQSLGYLPAIPFQVVKR